MSQIQIKTSLTHVDSRLALQGNESYTAAESEAAFVPTGVTATPETIDYGNIVSVGTVAIGVVSGDDLLVSLDGGSTWPLRIKQGGAVPLPLNTADLVETQTVTTVADTAGSLDGTYFVVEDVNAETWAIGDGILSHSEDNEISVSTDLTDATAAAVAAAFYAAMVANTTFMALFNVAYDADVDDDLITITDKNTGTRTDITDTGSTGFTLATTQQGGGIPTIQIKSTGTSNVTTAAVPKA